MDRLNYIVLTCFSVITLWCNSIIVVDSYLHPPHVSTSVVLPKEQWFQQKLDHFNPTDTRTWKQRFFVNETFYSPGGPAFLMIGGEGPASAQWMVVGSWVDYARQFNAILIQVEHRFYGKSHPTEDVSTKNLVYLSSEQALADLAYFVTNTTEKLNITNKWIAFGGSYPGSLATWVRVKYPHLIYASVSSSAPLIAQVDFKEYLEVVDKSLAFYSGGPNCGSNIKKSMRTIELFSAHRVGWPVLTDLFKLCQPFQASNPLDVSNLFEMLTENFNGIVQYNRDNREFEGATTGNITIETLCDIMNDDAIEKEIERLAAVNSMMLRSSNETCLNHTYSVLIDGLMNVNWDKNTQDGGRQWTYQTCTEFGWYQSSDSTAQPFGNEFPLKFYVDQCKDIFGLKFNRELLNEGIKWTNANYGSRSPAVSRVLFVNGNIDPWHKLGVTSDLNRESPAVFINGTAHCANMYPAADSDLPELVAARNKIRDTIGQWLQE